MDRLTAVPKYLFFAGRGLKWQGAGALAIILSMFVWALLATWGERSGLREGVVSLLILIVFLVGGLMLWGKVAHMLRKTSPPVSADERQAMDRMAAVPGLYTATAFTDFLNIAGWIIVPVFVLTVVWTLLGL